MNSKASDIAKHDRIVHLCIDKAKYIAKLRTELPTRNAQAYLFDKTDESTDDIETIAKAAGAPGIHTKIGEYPTVDAAWRQYNRVLIARQRVIVQATLNAFDLPAHELSFSRKLGCKCGCSPGFAVKRARGFTLYINEK